MSLASCKYGELATTVLKEAAAIRGDHGIRGKIRMRLLVRLINIWCFTCGQTLCAQWRPVQHDLLAPEPIGETIPMIRNPAEVNDEGHLTKEAGRKNAHNAHLKNARARGRWIGFFVTNARSIELSNSNSSSAIGKR